MLPIGPLMGEHRLIERMIVLMDRQLQRIRMSQRFDPAFLDVAIDFLRTYADRCHHAKEEGILFKHLSEKNLSEMHRNMMREFIREHGLARTNLRNLAVSRERCGANDADCIAQIGANLQVLIVSYRQHIKKEDAHFFKPCMGYFSKAEQEMILQECYEADRHLFHNKYTELVSEWEL